jgi:hypothetical protein
LSLVHIEWRANDKRWRPVSPERHLAKVRTL